MQDKACLMLVRNSGEPMKSDLKASLRHHILLITTADSSYPGADTVGQMHLEYSTRTSILRVPDPVMLPESFYLDCFRKGFDGIIVMSSGAECPFEGTYQKLSARISRITQKLKAQNIDFRRLKLCAICTVCTASFLKEVKNMEAILDEIGNINCEVFEKAANG